MISCSSQVTKLGSNPNFFLNSKNLFDDFLQLLIFFSTKPFRTNTLHGWYFTLGVNSCLYFCFSRSHLSKIGAQLATSDYTSKSFLFTPKYLPLSIISTSHFLCSSLLIWAILYIHKKKIVFYYRHKVINNFWLFPPIKITCSFLFFIFLNQIELNCFIKVQNKINSIL